ncbi:MAG TPA: EAL domain-containing protein [Mycobacteriales bacterium]|nr:EAL domain-containing protein [Mycobacteriales bacterium]
MGHAGEAQDEPSPLRLLLVADDLSYAAVVRAQVADVLPDARFDHATSMAAARPVLADRPDLVVADLSLPGLDVLEVIAGLRTACPEVAVVVLVTEPDEAYTLQAIAAGADDCLAKRQHDAASLGAAIRRAVQRTRAQSVRQRRERYAASLLEGTESSTCAVDSSGRVISVNAPWLAYASDNGGDPATSGVGADYLAACDGATGDRSEAAAEVGAGLRAVLAGTLPRYEREYACHSRDEQHWFSVRITPLPDAGGAVVTLIDVTRRHEAERERQHATLHHEATGLPNAVLLADRLDQALAEGGRLGHLVAVALVDVTTEGTAARQEAAGSVAGAVEGWGPPTQAVLAQVADRLTSCARDGDTVAQVEDTRFAVVWRDLGSAAEVETLAARLTSALAEPYVDLGVPVAVVTTLGLAVDEWAQTGEELLLAATAALHSPRRPWAHPPTEAPPVLRSEANLREAMRRGELVVHYQPVVDLDVGRVVGVEALVRWQHPTDGLLGPDCFIPIAESGGLIVALGVRVLEQACGQAARWHDSGLDLDMAVNLSARQVAHPDLLRTVVGVLRETGLDPARLVLEVTESAVMEDAEAAATVLLALADHGVSLAIDDFGTGYSSLVYLKRYPIQALKVDRSFVSGMGVSARDDAIVASVIGLAGAVGGSCIAEGVETAAQYEALLALGCTFGQGWLFGRAVPAEELPDLIVDCEARLTVLRAAADPDVRDRAGTQRDSAAAQRDQAGDQRDTAGDQRDEVADHRDAVAAQRDLAGDRRDQAGDERDEVGERRDREGRRRDQDADRRDQAADRRDQAADRRDEAADQRDATAERGDLRIGWDDGLTRAGDTAALLRQSAVARRDAAADREQASQDRQDGAVERGQAVADRDVALADRGAGADERGQAEHDRGIALADRGAGAGERDQADLDRHTAVADRDAGAGARSRADADRHTASADRDAAARERGSASMDGLTGAYLRLPGTVELQREVERARRTDQPLVVALLDVDGLAAVNDADGYDAGDQLLREVVAALRSVLRPYDLVVRYGGGEFVCALPGATQQEARSRLTLVDATLAVRAAGATVSVGLAELRPEDSAHDLVGRADAALHLQRRTRRT